ncbi:MAG: hypothetical protein NZZ41_02335 [Candidatus Dojkabacteria bacterium]|nr:hypothetical protein [Candidatus Dojkabacteria bacterium]
MTENTLIETPKQSTLPNQLFVNISKVYNGLPLIELYRKGNFSNTFGKIGVRRFGKFKQASDFFAFFHARLWEWVLKQVIDNNSVVIFGKTKIMLQSYRMKPHLNPDLIANNFRLTVPVYKRYKKSSLIWVTKNMIESINAPGRYSNITPSVLGRAEVRQYMMSLFPTLTKKQISSLVSFSINAMNKFVLASMNPTIKYNNTYCVIGDFNLCLKRLEQFGYKFYKREYVRDKHLKKLIEHVKRNYN